MPRRLLLLPLVLLAAACGDADAPEAPSEELTSADAVADAMLARFEANQLAVDGFTVVAAGAEARYRPAEADSAGLDPIRFEAGPAGDAPPAPEAQLLIEHVPNVARLAAGLRRATLVGTVNRDGRDAYLFTTDDPSVLIGEDAPAPPGDTQTARVYVDAATFDVLEIYRSVSDSTFTEPLTDRLIYSDFREVDGLTLPFTVRRVTTGVNQQIGEDEKMILGGQLGIARQTAESMPAGPERDARIAEIDAQMRAVNEGVAEMRLDIEEVRVGAPDAE